MRERPAFSYDEVCVLIDGLGLEPAVGDLLKGAVGKIQELGDVEDILRRIPEVNREAAELLGMEKVLDALGLLTDEGKYTLQNIRSSVVVDAVTERKG